MNDMKCYAVLMTVILLATSEVYSQSVQQRGRQPTWYERAARQVNPDNTDFGSIWEQRKEKLIDQLRNPYFRYGLAMTGITVLSIVALVAFYLGHRRALELAAQSIADIRQHDEYARRAAREATRRYNDHIEFCDRVIEGNENGLWKWMSGAELDAMKRRMQQTKEELAAAQQEIKQLKDELERETAVIAEMSLRSKDPARQGSESRKPSGSVPRAHIERINQLELELVDERKKNLRFKGGALDVHNS